MSSPKFMLPAPGVSAESVASCECCANRELHVYRADCLRCTARWLVRGIPRLAKQSWREIRKSNGPEQMERLRVFVNEERARDAAAAHHHTEGNA